MIKLPNILHGMHRMSIASTTHQKAIVASLDYFKGADTSSNYSDGQSELLLGYGLKHLRERKGIKEDEDDGIHVVTKFGFSNNNPSQISLSENNNQSSFKFSSLKVNSDYVKIAGMDGQDSGILHSIHPDFMRHQLSTSLQRIGRKSIETYLIHNPEHQLFDPPQTSNSNGNDNNNSDGDKAKQVDRREELYEKIYKCFLSLEEEVQSGRIKQYGLSSNSFSVPKADPTFLDINKIADLASKAFKIVNKTNNGNKLENEKKSNFNVIQLPINLLERVAVDPSEITGNGTVRNARDRGIQVIANRPFNAFNQNGSWRLADYPFPETYKQDRDAILSRLKVEVGDPAQLGEEEKDLIEACNWLRTFVGDMDAQMSGFTSVMHFEENFYGSILPIFNKKLDGIDDETAMILSKFFDSYQNAVKESSGHQARAEVVNELPFLKIDSRPLQEIALDWLLLKQNNISSIAVGMTSESHVDAVKKFMEESKNRSIY